MPKSPKSRGACRLETIEALCAELVSLRERDGRLFIIGVGGSAGNCSHAVNDFRKLCGIEAYAPTDNVSELTARTNDEGWPTVFAEWLKVSRANAKDAILVFSVGGGNLEKNVSPNIVRAIEEGKARGLKVFGIVGRDGGYTKKAGDVVVVIPTVEESRVTPTCRSVSGRGLALPGLAPQAAEKRHEMVRARLSRSRRRDQRECRTRRKARCADQDRGISFPARR